MSLVQAFDSIYSIFRRTEHNARWRDVRRDPINDTGLILPEDNSRQRYEGKNRHELKARRIEILALTDTVNENGYTERTLQAVCLCACNSGICPTKNTKPQTWSICRRK